MMSDSGIRFLEQPMALKSLIAFVALALLLVLGTVPHAAAQTQASPVAQPGEPSLPAPRTVRHRIEINPRPLLYRRCVDWYELQYRPSGTVLYPQMRCRWVRG
jgi:hypothetical protein